MRSYWLQYRDGESPTPYFPSDSIIISTHIMVFFGYMNIHTHTHKYIYIYTHTHTHTEEAPREVILTSLFFQMKYVLTGSLKCQQPSKHLKEHPHHLALVSAAESDFSKRASIGVATELRKDCLSQRSYWPPTAHHHTNVIQIPFKTLPPFGQTEKC